MKIRRKHEFVDDLEDPMLVARTPVPGNGWHVRTAKMAAILKCFLSSMRLPKSNLSHTDSILNYIARGSVSEGT
jgi:hypothetical protein